MKIDTDRDGRLVIEPDGNDSPIVNGIPQGVILVLRNATVIEVWEQNGAIVMRETKESELKITRNLRILERERRAGQ